MPTPSSNNPPPDLPPRTHSSTCPEDVRSSAIANASASTSVRSRWQDAVNDNNGVLGMSIDSNNATEPVGNIVTMAPERDQDIVSDLRSTTESPRPESRSHSSTEPLPSSEQRDDEYEDIESEGSSPSSHKMDADDTGDDGGMTARNDDAHTSSADADAAQRRSPSYDTASTLDHDDNDYESSLSERIERDMYAPSMGYNCSNVRTMPTSPSSFLRPGSRFYGTQQSERQVYEVQVEIKYVDLRESFLCGYLKIQGLTEDNPTLTTYFEGEIIGSKYGFVTKHDDWGATEKIDLSHWGKFSAFRQYAKQVRKGQGPVNIPNLGQRDNIFMRWKEHFLVPDHRVTTINGASFEGFYYICFNQREGSVSGIYFHSKSEKFQQLELKHKEDRGCFGAIEFR
ncbi:vacuolar import and degradation protein-domain-containing protein [Xylariaceae sp. FL0016]|nr:vacuolar import and degradation protein-domain-containing protein [Xylariaceae sp. FL0016]